jgi:chaperonin GroES
MSDPTVFEDPYGQPGSDLGASTLQTTTPPGSDLIIGEDGNVDVQMPEGPPPQDPQDHFSTLAETIDETRLSKIATDLLDAIKIDKQARAKRDKQYEEGLRRTGLGDDAPGGATFPGASRVVHPMLTASAIDFASRIMNEMMPPEGPVKAKTIGTPTHEKDDIGERVARYMNLQLTELMPNVAYEFEMGFTQCSLGGAFYTKTIYESQGMSVVAIPIDKVHRPWSDGSIYSQPRITHEMEVDKWQFEDNVRSGLWLDVVDTESSPDVPEPTRSQQATDRIIGRDQPSENIDSVRLVFESSVMMGLDDDDAPAEPYIVTVDEQSQKVLSIYRNWKQNDVDMKRLDFVIEWPFYPWRGGYPIGMTHMIGGLSGAATGSLRALLDAAHLNNSQTGVKLKGGATGGGQNIKANPMQTTEMQGSLAMDDVRKTYMPLPFPPPSPVLFNLLGFLVDAAQGVIRTTFDEFDKFGGQTPVGTANMFIEQGLKNFGAVHGRLHRSMARFLKQLWDINAETVDNVKIQDQFGELIVRREDFAGPMKVIPVSDPRIFSDIQRQSMAQLISQRAQLLPQVYNIRASEKYLLKQMKVPEPEQFLVPNPEPVQQNAVAENATSSGGLPIKAFPGQDHEAHLATHCAYIMSPLFGSNPIIAQKYLPVMLPHLAEHIGLWYADAMLDAANTVLRQKTGDPTLTIESMSGTQYEAPLDRMLAELTPEVMAYANERLVRLPEVIAQAQALMAKLAPPMPMDPSIVAMKDVDRQTQADTMKAEAEKAKLGMDEKKTHLQLVSTMTKVEADRRKMENDSMKVQADLHGKDRDRELREREVEAKMQGDREASMQKANDAALKAQTAQEANDARLAGIDATNESRESIADEANAVKLKIEDKGNQTALKMAKIKGRGNMTTGTAVSEGD